jgi:hypothetical protein
MFLHAKVRTRIFARWNPSAIASAVHETAARCSKKTPTASKNACTVPG